MIATLCNPDFVMTASFPFTRPSSITPRASARSTVDGPSVTIHCPGKRLLDLAQEWEGRTGARRSNYPPSGQVGTNGSPAGGREPTFQRGDRAGYAAAHDRDGLAGALLVSLAAPDSDSEAEFALFEVLDVERYKFGSAESPGEADQQQGAVALALDVISGGESLATIRSAVAGVFFRGAVPTLRRIPRIVALTRSSSVGAGWPASL
jgi:hypothetical protein